MVEGHHTTLADHFQTLDWLLLEIENEGYAAQIDGRTLEQADVPDVFPSLFEAPPEAPIEPQS